MPLRPLALAFAVLLAVLAGVLAFSPGARSAFLEIFHIRGATVERVENLPDVRAQRLDYGERVTREEAELRSGFQVLDLGASRMRSSSGRTGWSRRSTAIRRGPGSCSRRHAARSSTDS